MSENEKILFVHVLSSNKDMEEKIWRRNQVFYEFVHVFTTFLTQRTIESQNAASSE